MKVYNVRTGGIRYTKEGDTDYITSPTKIKLNAVHSTLQEVINAIGRGNCIVDQLLIETAIEIVEELKDGSTDVLN